jgi:hypothetical protein
MKSFTGTQKQVNAVDKTLLNTFKATSNLHTAIMK